MIMSNIERNYYVPLCPIIYLFFPIAHLFSPFFLPSLSPASYFLPFFPIPLLFSFVVSLICIITHLSLSTVIAFHPSFLSLYQFVISSFCPTFLPFLLHQPLQFSSFMFLHFHYFLPLIPFIVSFVHCTVPPTHQQ